MLCSLSLSLPHTTSYHASPGALRRPSCAWNAAPTRRLAVKLRLLLQIVLARVVKNPRFKSTTLLLQRKAKSKQFAKVAMSMLK